MPKIAIFTEAGSGYGYGHLSRCTALVDAFASFGFSSELFCRGNERVDWELDETAFDGYDIVVIDSYVASLDTYKKASKKAKLCIWLDDFCRIDYPKGITHNCSTFPILRKEFWFGDVRKPVDHIGSVFLNMGSLPVDFDFETSIRKVFGADVKIVSPQNVSAVGMMESMHSCDVAVTAAGQTLLELASLGIASIAVVTAENQLQNARKLQSAGACLVVDAHGLSAFERELAKLGDISMQESALNAKNTLFAEAGALKLAADALAAIALGAPQNVLMFDKRQEINGVLVGQFWQLDETALQEVLEWRNHQDIRKWMFGREPIDWNEHMLFTKKLKTTRTKLYFKAKDLGVISLSNIDYALGKADIGIYKAPNATKGSGTRLLWVLIVISLDKIGLDRLRAEVYGDNMPAVKLYERFGFCKTDSYDDKNGTVVVYELKKGRQ